MNSERQLMNTQAGLAAMMEANQTALVSHITALLIPIQADLMELRALVGGMSGQINHIHERQEAMERSIRAYVPPAAEEMME